MSNILSIIFIQNLIVSVVRMATPLLFVSLGELYSERAGLVNIGLDGLMTIGACVGFIAATLTNNPFIGILAGALAGIVMNMIFAFSTITLRAGQIINGMAINILAPALATFLYREYFGVSTGLTQGPQMKTAAIPLLSKIPIIGPALFNVTPLTYLAVLLLLATSIFFKRTHAGLNFKAVGENPLAAESLGINAIRVKYLACVICGALAGIGGAFLVTSYMNSYSNGIVGGRGFIALSAVIFGGWRPAGILGATLLFGFADALQLRLQLILPQVPNQFFTMLPYLSTLLVLAFAGTKHKGPKANGQPYFREAK